MNLGLMGGPNGLSGGLAPNPGMGIMAMMAATAVPQPSALAALPLHTNNNNNSNLSGFEGIPLPEQRSIGSKRNSIAPPPPMGKDSSRKSSTVQEDLSKQQLFI
eukprot:TRINITY_DN127_c1_g1_i1.p2 TRINITY_DN127_c1_g1~~TRINITY_DN127_c1_g1_i1.p2  ORF type:complete len:104 (-),score=38.79 TRINITY_DN127_c1_g1_i1:473-784(-)